VKKKQQQDTVMCRQDNWETVARSFGWKDADISTLRSILDMGPHENLSLEVGRMKIAVRETLSFVFRGIGRDGQVHEHTIRRTCGSLWRRSMEFASMVSVSETPRQEDPPPQRVVERVMCGCPIRSGKLWQHEGDCPVAERRRLERIDAEIRMLEGGDDKPVVAASPAPKKGPQSKAALAKARFKAAQTSLL